MTPTTVKRSTMRMDNQVMVLLLVVMVKKMLVTNEMSPMQMVNMSKKT